MKQKIRDRFRLVGEEPAGAARTPGGGDADLSIEELDQQVRAYRRKMRLRTVIGIAVAVLFAVGIFLFINLQTYSSVRILDVYPAQDAGNSSYREFASGVLKYSRDGIALLDRRGDEVWNQSYQMQNPMVHVFGDSAVVADKDGNSMIVVDRDGLKGELEASGFDTAADIVGGVDATVNTYKFVTGIGSLKDDIGGIFTAKDHGAELKKVLFESSGWKLPSTVTDSNAVLQGIGKSDALFSNVDLAYKYVDGFLTDSGLETILSNTQLGKIITGPGKILGALADEVS